MSTVNEQLKAHFEDELKPRRRGWLFWLFVLFLGLIVLVLLAPTILTRTSARDWLLAKVIPSDTAVVSVRDMQVGWFSPMKIEGLRVLDAEGKPLAEVERIEGDRSLFSLANNSSDIGSLVVTDPTLHLQLRADGSNLEDTIAKLTSSEEEPAEPESSEPSALAAHVRVVNAKVIAVDETTGTTWNVDDLNALAILPPTTSAEWIVETDGKLDGQPFAVKMKTPMGMANEKWPLGPTGEAQLAAEALPLAPLRYAALRSGQPVEELFGTLTVNAGANWAPESGADIPKLNAAANIRTDNLKLAAESLIGRDVLQLASANIETKASIAHDIVTLENCDLQSDFGTASLKTVANLTKLSDPNAIVQTLRNQQLQTMGQLDVAALARALPHTMKIRDDVHIASGRVGWNVQSQVAAGVPTRWTGAMQTADVKIVRDEQPIDWQFPLEVNFAVTDGQEIELENVTARSDFFSLVGSGKLRGGTLQAQADLERLVYQLSQVIDVSDVYVRGQMLANVKWLETQPNQLKLDASTKLSKFVMTQYEKVVCQEDELNTMLTGKATLDGQSIASLDEARFDIVSAGDFLVAQLQGAVAKPDANATWPVVCRLKGNLATWMARLKPFGIADGWEIGGEIDTTTQVTANQRGVAVQSLQANVQQLSAVSDGIRVIEPIVQIETAGTVDLTTMACRFPTATIASQSVSLGANDVSVDMDPHFVVAGNIGYKADIERLMNYIPPDPANPANQRISGLAVGQVRVQSNEQTSSFQLDGNIENLRIDDLGLNASSPQTGQAVQQGPSVLWQEPSLAMKATGSYDAIQDRLELQEANVTGRMLNLVANGSASQLATTPVVDFAGEYAYDLDGLMAVLGDMLGPDIKLTGQHRQQFSARGPIFPVVPSPRHRVADELVVKAGAAWQSATAYDVTLGSAQVDANLANGVLQVAPIEVAVGEGRARVAPTLHVNTEPLWMTMEPQVVADQIQITPDMTRKWMKYIAPLLADATHAEGRFSVALSKTEVPLMDPVAGNVNGEFTVHGGSLGPGPLATQFIQLASNIKRMIGKGESQITDPSKMWVELAPQTVAFSLQENRVYHEGFTMVIDGVTVRTRGSVGMLDESVAVMAEVPILDEWIDGTPALRGLRGQVVSIPVSGTTSRPQLDQRALAQVTTQIARSAATGYIQDQLGSKLKEKLGGGTVDEAIGGAQEKLNGAIQNEIGNALNKLFK